MIVTTGIVLALLCSVCSSQSCDLTELDRCAVSYFCFDYNASAILQPSDWNEYCRHIHEGGRCTRDYVRRCLPRVLQIDMDILLNNVEKINKYYCDRPGATEEHFIGDHLRCTTDYFASVNSCVPKFVSDLEAASAATRENAWPLACCFYAEFQDCYMNNIRRQTDECRSWVEETRIRIGITLLTDGCNESSETCRNIVESVDRSKPPTFASHLPPLVNVLELIFSE